MTVKTESSNNEVKIVDDLSDQVADEQVQDKLKALKAKLAAKDTEGMSSTLARKRVRSYEFGVVGSGQGGSKIAAAFYELGYKAVVFNTASQDLEHIKIPDDNKFLFKYGMGGAAKELEIGRAAAEAYREDIGQLVTDKLDGCQILVLCLSLGGGSGAGSAETMVDVLSEQGKPIVVITVLPMAHEDVISKRNAIETLSKLTKEVQAKRIANLIVVDNAKIENIYSNVSQFDFFNVSNQAIVEPIDAFNCFSAMSSSVKGLDSMEFAKLMTDGGGLTIYGEMCVPNYEEDTAIAEAVVNNLNNGLLASGFNLKQSKYVGVIVAANKNVWDKIPSASINYAMSMVHDICGTPNAVFRGIYTSDSKDDEVKVYSMFTGLGLPESRIEQLKKETKESEVKTKAKEDERNLNLKLDTGTEETVSQTEMIKKKIAMKKSAFGGLLSNTVDLRKK